MGDTIIIETPVATVLEVSGKQGPQGVPGATGATGAVGPAGPAGTGIETLTQKGDLLSRNDSAAIRVGIGSTGQVLKVSAQGIPSWANESGAVTSVNGQTGAVTVADAQHAAEHAAGTKAQYNDQVAGMSTNVLIRANNVGTAGNSIALNFDGVDDIATVLGAWNSANPSNQATLISGDGSQVPDNGEEITLSGGAAGGTDPVFDQDLNVANNVQFNQVATNQIVYNDDLSDKFIFASGKQGWFVAQTRNTNDGFIGIRHVDGNDNQVGLSILGIRDGVGFVQGLGTTFRVESDGGDLSTALVKNIVLRDQENNTTATFDAQDALTANRTYDLPDASGTLALTSDIPANTIASTIVDAKGDLIVGTAADTVARLPVGATNGHVLTVDSAEASGMKWAAASGGVTSVSGTAPIVSSGGTTPTISVTTGTTAGTVAAGDDSRITGAAQKSANLSDLASASTARTNLGVAIGTDVAAASHTHTASAISDSTTAGRALLTAADAAAQRTSLGLGTAATSASSAFAAASHTHSASDITSGTLDNARVNFAAPAAIGGTTPNSITGTVIVANTELTIPSSSPASPSAGDIYRVTNDLRFRDSTNTERTVSVTGHTHSASDITSGLAASATTDTTNASNITSGTVPIARIPTGTTSTTVALGNHSHELTALAATGATNGHVLTANGSNGATFAALPASGVTGAAASASDVLGVSGANITGVDANADRIVFWDDSASALKHLTVGSGLSISDTTISATATGTIGGSTSTDNSIVRADSTSNTVQDSALVIDDAVVPFNITGDASTDVITAVGHNFSTNQGVRFPTLTGGSGLTAATTNYFVRDINGDTFKVSTTSGGAAVNFTTNITAGTVIAMQANVAIRNNSSQTNSALVLTPKGNGALILGAKPDGTATVGGNPRGDNAVDLQFVRNAATQVASGLRAVIVGGANNTASNQESIVLGGSSNNASGAVSCILGGSSNAASNDRASCLATRNSTISGDSALVLNGFNTTASGAQSIAMGAFCLADRSGMMARSNSAFVSAGDAQRAWYCSMFNKTSAATATELFIDGSSSRLTIPSGKTISMFINIVAATSGGEFANRYVRAVTIANRGGTTALRGAVKDIDTEEQITGADVTISANDTNDALRVEFSGVAPVTGCTGTASTDRINKVAHGFNNNDDIIFSSLTGGAGLTANTVTYWVINANADDFQVSATRGGAAVNITTDYSDMTAARMFRVVAYVDGAEVAFGT